MVEAGCAPEIPYFRYQRDVRADGPVFDEYKDELSDTPSILINYPVYFPGFKFFL
jgi:hypothetical protein